MNWTVNYLYGYMLNPELYFSPEQVLNRIDDHILHKSKVYDKQELTKLWGIINEQSS